MVKSFRQNSQKEERILKMKTKPKMMYLKALLRLKMAAFSVISALLLDQKKISHGMSNKSIKIGMKRYTVHRGAFCQFPLRWIYYCHSSKSTGKETGKMHLCALANSNGLHTLLKVKS